MLSLLRRLRSRERGSGSSGWAIGIAGREWQFPSPSWQFAAPAGKRHRLGRELAASIALSSVTDATSRRYGHRSEAMWATVFCSGTPGSGCWRSESVKILDEQAVSSDCPPVGVRTGLEARCQSDVQRAVGMVNRRLRRGRTVRAAIRSANAHAVPALKVQRDTSPEALRRPTAMCAQEARPPGCDRDG